MSNEFKLDKGKLKNFLSSINTKQKPNLDISGISDSNYSNISITDIQDLKDQVKQMQNKINLLLSSKDSSEALKMSYVNKNLNYLKERVDLLIHHKDIKGEISNIEMKQLRVNILKDKIQYLQSKLDSILTEREKRFQVDKEFSIIRKERLTKITNRIIDLENRLDNISKPTNDDEKKIIDRINNKIDLLKKRSSGIISSRMKKGDDMEFKVINQISKMLDEKKQELNDLETELMLEQGIVEPKEKPEKPKIETELKKLKPSLKKKKLVSTPKLKIKQKEELHQFDLGLPTFSSGIHDFDLELPSPVPLEEYKEEVHLRPVKVKKKKEGFFKMLLRMMGFKKK